MTIDTRMMYTSALPSNQFDENAARTDEHSAPSMYWRLNNGYIHLLPAGANGTDRAMRGAGIPLSAYGLFARFTRRGLNPEKDEMCFLVQSGGAHELPPQQVFELRWHRRPTRNDTWSHRRIWETVENLIHRGFDERTAIDEALPQLRGVDLPQEYTCAYCHGRTFLSHDNLIKHEGVMHRDDVRTREMRESISDALKTQSSGSGDLSQVIALLADTLAKIGSQNSETKEMVESLVSETVRASRAKPAPKRRGRPPKKVAPALVDDVA